MIPFFHNFPGQLKTFFNNSFSSVFAAAFAAILITSSCEEDPTKIGNRLLPSTDFVSVGSTDTLSVRAYTEYSDSILSGNPSTAYMGALSDKYFGRTTAEFVTQLRLLQPWKSSLYGLEAIDILKIDSIKIYLRFLTTTGSGEGPHYLKISEIKDKLFNDTVYYSSEEVDLEGYVMPRVELPALRTDTINSIALNLPVSFAERLMLDTTKLFHSSKDSDFRDYFKGIYMQLESDTDTDPVLVSFSTGNDSYYGSYANYISVYFHVRNDTAKVYEFLFLIDAVSRNASYIRYIHEFDEATALEKVQEANINSTILDSLVYMQVMNGLYTRLTIPGLEEIKNDPDMNNIAVNKARLTLPIMYGDNYYKPSKIPQQLYVRYKDKDGERYYVPDLVSGADYFNGTPDSTKNVYSVNLATFVQNYLNDTENKYKPEVELFLQPSSPSNLILRANDNNKHITFDFTYTKF